MLDITMTSSVVCRSFPKHSTLKY